AGLRLAYFHHLKGTGATLKDIAGALDISERQAKRLQKQLREHFLDVEAEHSLPVRIEFMLWVTPMSRARICQVLSEHTHAEVDEAIAILLRDERIIEVPGRTLKYAANRDVNDLARDNWIARIGGLTSLAANLADTVFSRFVARDPGRALSRTLTFLVRDEDVAELETIFREKLVPAIAELDARAQASGDGSPIRMSILWAPYDAIKESEPNEEDDQ
ncbi:MAG: hypothetical protein KC561_20515, partial [Myxococcales bacterium]|nr:hypothetical protein [Myxococcales bacterium]